jgi:hypothetical protein
MSIIMMGMGALVSEGETMTLFNQTNGIIKQKKDFLQKQAKQNCFFQHTYEVL